MYLDWEKQARDAYTIDIETDDLNATVIYVMCWENLKTGETGDCIGHDQVKKFFEETRGSLYVGHNILKFDGPTTNRLVGTNLDVSNCIDTLVLSTLYSPSLSGGHSLDAWGERMGEKKISFCDWSHLSDEMIVYCRKDVEITSKLFKRLIKTLTAIEFSESSIWLQHRLTVICDKQTKSGFKFDGPRAIVLYTKLRAEEEKLRDEVHKVFPPKRVLVAERQLRRADGEYTAIYVRDLERYEIETTNTNTYRAYEYQDFNLGSPQQRVKKLTELGWVPREFTKNGNPKPFDKGKLSPSLEEFLETHDIPEVKLIAEWMAINGRANMVNTWLENWNEETGCIHGKLFVADTLRFRHQSPNTANIPAVRFTKDDPPKVQTGKSGYYTYEARDLWVARTGRVLVGTDAAGLELRMLAHYLNRDEFTRQVIEGDPHQYNADTVGVTRPQAKTLIYAIMYGAAAPKIAATLGVSVREGGRIRTMFLERLGLKELIEECQNEQKSGRVTLCDGSQVVCPSPHSALNYKLQGGGARVMGLGSVILEGVIRRREIDAIKVGDIHDEWQYDVHPDHADTHAEASVQAIREAGQRLKLNVPLDGEAKKGLTWAETH